MALIMGGASIGKDILFDGPARQRQNALAAKQTELSPWTGIAPQQVQQSQLGNNLMQGMFTGALLGQNMNESTAEQALLDAKAKRMEKSPWGTLADEKSPGGKVAKTTIKTKLTDPKTGATQEKIEELEPQDDGMFNFNIDWDSDVGKPQQFKYNQGYASPVAKSREQQMIERLHQMQGVKRAPSMNSWNRMS